MQRNTKTVVYLAAILVVMTGLSFASVPLYRLFCQMTGFDGTTMFASKAPEKIMDRVIAVRFNTDIDSNLDWSFQPSVRSVDVKVGDVATMTFQVKNNGNDVVVGTSTYNVTPEKVGAYFNKLQCFCFTRHVLKPGETAEFPVQFFIDPAIAENHKLDDINEVTLSYTFFKAPDQNLISQDTNIKNTGTKSYQ